MCAAAKATGDPTRSWDRAGATGLSARLPRNADPLVLVIHTDSVSNDVVPVRNVTRTTSKALLLRTAPPIRMGDSCASASPGTAGR